MCGPDHEPPTVPYHTPAFLMAGVSVATPATNHTSESEYMLEELPVEYNG